MFCRVCCAFLSSVMAVFAAMGCQPSPQLKQVIGSYHAGDFTTTERVFLKAADKPDENFVLNNLRVGSAALATNHLDLAEVSFLKAYEVLNATGVNNGGRTASAVIVSEQIKIWKGEPFERAMANFYLGLVYYIRHDYNNARGAFENSLFKLRDYAGKSDTEYTEVESRFVIAHVMLGRCFARLGRDDLAKANFAAARQFCPRLEAGADLETHRQSNVLLVVDYGHGPCKDFVWRGAAMMDALNNRVTAAKDRETWDGILEGFWPKPDEAGDLPRPLVWADGAAVSVSDRNAAPVDLLAMAQQPYWQDMKTIRAIKSATGNAAIIGGAAAAGGVGLLAGLAVRASSQADTREWEQLPRCTFILPLRLPAGTHQVTVDFGVGYEYPTKNTVPPVTKTVTVPPKGEVTAYLRTLSPRVTRVRHSDLEQQGKRPLLVEWKPQPRSDSASMLSDIDQHKAFAEHAHEVAAPREPVWQAIEQALASTKEEIVKSDRESGVIFSATRKNSVWLGPRQDFYRLRVTDAGAGRTHLSLKYLRFDGGSNVPCTAATAKKAADALFEKIDNAVGQYGALRAPTSGGARSQ